MPEPSPAPERHPIQASVFIPARRPPSLRWAANLAYLQFTASLAGTMFGTSLLTEEPARHTDPDVGNTPLVLVHTGFMLLLTLASLLSAVLLRRRDDRMRRLAVAVQLAYVGSLAVTVLLLFEANTTASLILLVQAAAIAVLAPLNLILLSHPGTRQWYERRD